MCDKILEIQERIEKDPKNYKLWLEKGLEYVAQNRYAEAREAFSVGLIYNPFSEDCYRERGRKFISEGRYPEAVADLTMASRLDPYNNEHWYYQGVAAHLGEMYERAIEAFPYAIECMKKQGIDEWLAAVDWMWLTYNKLGMKDKAAEIITTVDEDTPCIPRSLSYKRRVLLYRGIIKPEEFLDREALKSTDRPELYLISELFGLGNYYYSIGEEEKGNELLKEARDIPSWHASFAYQLVCKELEKRGL